MYVEVCRFIYQAKDTRQGVVLQYSDPLFESLKSQVPKATLNFEVGPEGEDAARRVHVQCYITNSSC